MSISHDKLTFLDRTFCDIGVTLHDLVSFVLSESSHSLLPRLGIDATTLLTMLHRNEHTHEVTWNWARSVFYTVCREEICKLSHRDAGLHFRAKYAKASQLESFDIMQLVEKFHTLAPTVWTLVGTLLDADADSKLAHRRRQKKAKRRRRKAQMGGRDQQEREERMDVGPPQGEGRRQEQASHSGVPLLWEDMDGPDADEDPIRWRAHAPRGSGDIDSDGDDDDDDLWRHFEGGEEVELARPADDDDDDLWSHFEGGEQAESAQPVDDNELDEGESEEELNERSMRIISMVS